MGTISSAFRLISGALNADQSGLSVIANNVANANTQGYTEERPNWSENQPVSINGVYYGTGVSQTGATSVRDRVLIARLDQQQQLAASSSSRLAALNTIQALFTPDSGAAGASAGDIGSDITSLFSSFGSLEANPTNDALRQRVLSSGATLAGDISNAAASLNSQRSALDQEAAGVTSQVNALTSVIAQLNAQIRSTSPQGDAGILEDQRQQDITKLSQLIGINQITTENNGLAITTSSGMTLVSGNSSYDMTTGSVNGVTHFFVGTADITSQMASGGGALGGYLAARDQDIPGVLASLDTLAFSISTRVNAVNDAGTDAYGVQGTGTDATGVTGSGNTPLYIFGEPAQVAGSALAMSVVMTDPNQIAAAGFKEGSGGNANAIALATLADQALSVPSATTNFSLIQNLSSTTPINAAISTQLPLFDSLGHSYAAPVTYTNQGGNSWHYSIAMPETLRADSSVAGQVSYSFGAGETVNAGTNLTITGPTGSGPATISAPVIVPGEILGSGGPPATGYLAALQNAVFAAGITGVSISAAGGVLTISGAASTAGSVMADPVASAASSGTLQFDGAGNLLTPATNISGISFSGLSDGAPSLHLNWQLYDSTGKANLSQKAGPSTSSGQSQNGFNLSESKTPAGYFSNFVTALGATVAEVQTENTAQNASVTQLQNQNDALSAVNLNDEAAAMQQLERSYQAASKVFSILNSIMSSALNLGVQTSFN